MSNELVQKVVTCLSNFPSELVVITVAALPISELRGAIPLAILKFKMNAGKAVVLSVLGNMLPIPFILLLLEPMYNIFKKIYIFDIFFNWLFNRTRRKEESFKKYGPWALMLFVAIPLPVTGAWTGAVAAFVFGIKNLKALFMIFLGVLIAALIVTISTIGIQGILNFIF